MSDLSSEDRDQLLGLLEEAISKAGGVRALAREIGWDIGSMGRVRAGRERLSAYRAAQVVEHLGMAPQLGSFLALRAGAKSAAEREYWDKIFEVELQQFQLLNLSRIVRHAETKANAAGADAEKYLQAARDAREAIADAVAAGAELPPAMKDRY